MVSYYTYITIAGLIVSNTALCVAMIYGAKTIISLTSRLNELEHNVDKSIINFSHTNKQFSHRMSGFEHLLTQMINKVYKSNFDKIIVEDADHG